jgi:hypothetical protein
MNNTFKTMSISGGIDMYSYMQRYKTDICPKGRKVIFLNKNGYDSEREYARKLFSEGDILTVKEIYVNRCSSEVEFEEYPGKMFNTIMFGDIK